MLIEDTHLGYQDATRSFNGAYIVNYGIGWDVDAVEIAAQFRHAGRLARP